MEDNKWFPRSRVDFFIFRFRYQIFQIEPTYFLVYSIFGGNGGVSNFFNLLKKYLQISPKI
jgi:hypothetical protein